MRQHLKEPKGRVLTPGEGRAGLPGGGTSPRGGRGLGGGVSQGGVGQGPPFGGSQGWVKRMRADGLGLEVRARMRGCWWESLKWLG